jgi:hypothetical protein
LSYFLKKGWYVKRTNIIRKEGKEGQKKEPGRVKWEERGEGRHLSN